jgi:hypothetical protein
VEVQVGYGAGRATAGSRYPGRGRQRVETEKQRSRDLRPQFRLRPGQDDLLIEWLTSLAPRQRSEAIREVLYRHLAERDRAGEGEGDWAEDPDLAAALDALF